MTTTAVRLNGRDLQLSTEPEMPLLWLVRGELGLTGTKFGCGMALCGACTVHLDGQPVRGCVTPLSAAAGREVTTIEGLQGREADAVRAAWLAQDVVQCGWCQSGQIMAATALLRQTPAPTDAHIDAALSGHLCRCGTYPRIRAAVHDAARRLASA
jgi:isoquinoline 1-oxidoreductase subunit alpha